MKLRSRFQKIAPIALLVVGLGPALAFGAGTPKTHHQHGIIKSVDMAAQKMVVSESKNKEHTFQWNDQTKFREQSKSTSANALKEGEHVRFSYKPGGETPLLQRVEISGTSAKRSAEDASLTRSKSA
jgi:hypothetical protein